MYLFYIRKWQKFNAIGRCNFKLSVKFEASIPAQILADTEDTTVSPWDPDNTVINSDNLDISEAPSNISNMREKPV